MEEQPLDIKGAAAVIKRRPWIVGVATVIGICIGIVYALTHPLLPSATAMVILPTTAGAGASCTTLSTVQAQVAIATSAAVLAKAGASNNKVKVTSSNNLLAINVEARKGSDAETLANHVAIAYMSEAGALGNNMQDAQVEQLTVDNKTLLKEGTNLSGQIAAVQQAIISVDSNNIVGSQALSASTFTKPTPWQSAIYGLFGLVGGLIVGCLIASWRGRKDEPVEDSPDPPVPDGPMDIDIDMELFHGFCL